MCDNRLAKLFYLNVFDVLHVNVCEFVIVSYMFIRQCGWSTFLVFILPSKTSIMLCNKLPVVFVLSF